MTRSLDQSFFCDNLVETIPFSAGCNQVAKVCLRLTTQSKSVTTSWKYFAHSPGESKGILLHYKKTHSQTLDSSKAFRTKNSQKHSIIFNNLTLSCDKKTIKNAKQSKAKPRYSFLLVVVKVNFVYFRTIFCFVILACRLNFTRLDFRIGSNHLKRSHFRDTAETSHKKTTNPSAILSSSQTFLLWPLASEGWPCVGMGNSHKSTFLHLLRNQKNHHFSGKNNHSNHQLNYQLTCSESWKPCHSCILLRVYNSDNKFYDLSGIQTPTFPPNFLQFSFSQMSFFCSLVLFWRTKQVTLNHLIKENS